MLTTLLAGGAGGILTLFHCVKSTWPWLLPPMSGKSPSVKSLVERRYRGWQQADRDHRDGEQDA
jgi:hypothetical protein